MKNFLIFLGSVISSCLLFAIPIFTALSIALGWDCSVIFIFVTLSIGEFILTTSTIYFDNYEN